MVRRMTGAPTDRGAHPKKRKGKEGKEGRHNVTEQQYNVGWGDRWVRFSREEGLHGGPGLVEA